jgi:hypothetical protein
MGAGRGATFHAGSVAGADGEAVVSAAEVAVWDRRRALVATSLGVDASALTEIVGMRVLALGSTV